MSKTVSVRLEEDVLEQLEMMAKAADRSRAWLMAQAINQYVEHQAWQIEAIKKALEKLEKGKAKFASHKVVEEWVYSWGAKDEQERPQCR